MSKIYLMFTPWRLFFHSYTHPRDCPLYHPYSQETNFSHRFFSLEMKPSLPESHCHWHTQRSASPWTLRLPGKLIMAGPLVALWRDCHYLRVNMSSENLVRDVIYIYPGQAAGGEGGSLWSESHIVRSHGRDGTTSSVPHLRSMNSCMSLYTRHLVGLFRMC